MFQAAQHSGLLAGRLEHSIGQLAIALSSDGSQQGGLVLKMPVRCIVRDACLASHLSQGEGRWPDLCDQPDGGLEQDLS